MPVLEAEEIWKSYPRWRPGSRSLRSMLSPGLRSGRRSRESRWALREISFELGAGHSLGVIGHNGAGKSTLLRLATGLTKPTRGSLRVTPETAAVLSLGGTFDADLTGSANAVTAAVIAGLSPAQARQRLPEALAFAELEGFEDAPVRSYSEGMKLRLAFGVLTVLTPDLLILDEVLAVGDLGFQQKCMAHLHRLRKRGTAIVLASHDLAQIAEQCERVLLIDGGRMKALGDAGSVIEQYQQAVQAETLRVTPEKPSSVDAGELVLNETRFGSQEMQIDRVLAGAPGSPGEVASGERLDVVIRVNAVRRAEPLTISVSISRQQDEVKCLDVNTGLDEVTVDSTEGAPVSATLSLDSLELRPGSYWVDVGVFPLDWSYAYDYHWHVHPLTVTGSEDDAGAVYRPQQRRWTVGRE